MTEPRNPSTERTHLYPWERAACEEFAARMGVSDEKLRKAIRVVGSRSTTLSSYLKAWGRARPVEPPRGRRSAAPFFEHSGRPRLGRIGGRRQHEEASMRMRGGTAARAR